MKKNQVNLGVREVPSIPKWIALSLQHLFAMFGATILVPFLTGLSPAVALVSSGVGTLAYMAITKGRIPAYLGSSFAFIPPIIAADQAAGVPGIMMGSLMAGLVYGVVALLIKGFGTKWIMKILPPVVVGPVIIVIGLGLASTAVDMAMNDSEGNYSLTFMMIAAVTLGLTIIASLFFKGFMNIIPVLFGITGGYLFALTQGVVDTSGIAAEWNQITSATGLVSFLGSVFQMPDFTVPFVDFTPGSVPFAEIALIMVPIAFVTIAEHIGDQMVLSKVVGQNFLEKPGLHRSIAGDGIATVLASCLGGPPNTTYGENIGVLAITKVFSVFVIGGAAVTAIFFGFIGIVTEVIGAIPSAVMGGVSILLFGIIASSGLRMLIDNNIDLGDKRNLIISSVILVIGVGGAKIQIADFEVSSMALATIVGVILNLFLPGRESAYGNGNMFKTEEQTEAEKSDDSAA
ncbi:MULTISPECIES: solute carrier family 23 protein [Pontibacillus]|uniref:Solute carrier family 23 protein n=1 Tax=Pontibacillus chungwhensis TaxID=265426 RepID=A0ABY8V7S5_9BACI|nr:MULTISPECIES: solute carrier family 23 protein [Pontibacillus]MCD5322613.1 NCS2 family nucleobase:cation symporter [Pontibacillus sp. HN14]WIF99896.1 solute carrier family 23 protein [Pontibacillus chungwhensis]